MFELSSTIKHEYQNVCMDFQMDVFGKSSIMLALTNFWDPIKLLLHIFVIYFFMNTIYYNLQGAARLLADLNLAPSALKWWEKGGVGIIGKGTPRSFVSPLGLVTAMR